MTHGKYNHPSRPASPLEWMRWYVPWCAHLAGGQALQEVGLARAIGANEPIAAPNGELDGAVLDELIPVQTHAEAIDLDVPGSRPGRQDARHSPLVLCLQHK